MDNNRRISVKAELYKEEEEEIIVAPVFFSDDDEPTR
jgi:hypothetical protein